VPNAAFFPIVVGIYSVAAYYRRAWISCAVLLATAAVVAVTLGEVAPGIPSVLSPFAVVVPLWLVGNQIRLWRSRAEASTSRAERLERERDAATRAAIAQERARIARELHDVVSHNVSVMVIQATAARQVVPTDPDAAATAMRAVEQVGQEAMAELRHMLNLLDARESGAREDADDEGPPSPQPGLAQLDALLARVRAAGLRVSARRDGVPRPLAAGLDVAAYRVVQEGLTNVLRHAPGATAAVVVTYGEDGLLVEVSNDQPSAAGPAIPHGSGSGLLGLAERVRLYHGDLQAGFRLDGGYRVRATIPWEADA
jgi:signal transduction histidine kinase